MLDVKNIFAVFLCVSLLALQPLINLKFFYIDFLRGQCLPLGKRHKRPDDGSVTMQRLILILYRKLAASSSDEKTDEQ